MESAPGNSTSHTLSALEENSVYSFSIISRNGSGDSYPPEKANATTDIAGIIYVLM